MVAPGAYAILAPLFAGMRELCGWYHVLDVHGREIFNQLLLGHSGTLVWPE